MPGNKKIRCAVVHDHTLLRQGLRRLLEDEDDVDVVAEASTAAEALLCVLEYRPEIVIADATVFGRPADQVERLIQQQSPRTRVLFLTMHDEDSGRREGRVHRNSCTVRQTSAQELVEAVRKIHSVRNAVREMPRRNYGEWPPEELMPRGRALTTREQEVLRLLAEGRTVRSAAAILGLSSKTVDAHKFNLMRKLGIHNKAELVMWAIQKRVVKLPANF